MLARSRSLLAVLVVAACGCDSGQLVTLGIAPTNAESDEPEPVMLPDDDTAPEMTMTAMPPTMPPTVVEPAPTGGAPAVSPPVEAGAGGVPEPEVEPEPPVLSEEPEFGEAMLIEELASDVEDENPTLTEDLLQIYFTSRREGGPGNADVWFSERATPDDPFSEPLPVPEVSTEEFDSSPAISPDGLMLWTAIDVEAGLGGLDIWVSTRATRSDSWSDPVNVVELNSPEDDLPRPIGDDGRVMPIQSRRDGSVYQMYLAIRESEDGAFGTPLLLNSLLLEGQAMGDGFVTYDGLGVYFAYSIEDSGDLYFASRPSRDDDFRSAVPIESLNSDADERDPWLSPDGQRLYFASDRDGVLNIYEARLISR